MNTQPTDEQPIDLSGRVLGPYKLRERIGVGGTATVYRAEVPETKAEVAIKVLHRGSDRTTVLRFQKEISLARILCEQANRHLARVVMDGLDDGLYWVAMDLMRGKTVREILGKAPNSGLRWEAAAFIVMNICGAVASMHDLEVVHRDLKPENIFLSRTATGQLWVTLLDLGIAKEFSAEPKTQEGVHLTDRNELPGTGPYMAPERVLGGPCTPATDQYSLGVLLYECLHRQLPYPPSENYTALRLQVHGSLADLPWNKLPSDLKQIVLRAMSKERGERFPNVLDMGRALHGCLESASDWVDGKRAAMELLEAPPAATASRPVERPLDEKTTDTSFQKPRAPDAPRPPLSEAPSETQPWPNAKPVAPVPADALANISVQPTMVHPARAPANTRGQPPDRADIPARAPASTRGQPPAKADLPARIPANTRAQSPARPDSPVKAPADAPAKPPPSGINPSTDTGSRVTSESEVTIDEPAQNALLVRHGPMIFRIMRGTLRVTMIAIVWMMALAGDPQWSDLQKWLTQPTRDGAGNSDADGAPATLGPKVPHTPSPSIPTGDSESAPRDLGQGTASKALPNPPNPGPGNKGSKSALKKREKTDLPPAPVATTAHTGNESVDKLLPVKASEDKIRKRAIASAQALIHELCPLSPGSPAGGGKVCVDLMINALGKPQSGSVKTFEPANLSFVDKQGAGCVLRVAKAHTDLKQLSHVPSTFEHCFTVKP